MADLGKIALLLDKIGGVVSIIAGILGILGFMATLGGNALVAGIVAILIGVAVLYIEFEKTPLKLRAMLKVKLIRGIVMIVAGILASGVFAGLLILIGGILYLIDHFT